MKISRHAKERLRQRGMKMDHLHMIIDYGLPVCCRGRATRYEFNNKVYNETKSLLKYYLQMLDKLKGRCVVVSEDDNVITVY